MGTCSYVLTGTQTGMENTFGTTCHGAVSLDYVLLTIDHSVCLRLIFFGMEARHETGIF